MAGQCARAGGFPAYAEWLIDSPAWRRQITATARRQRAWRPGYQDADLLAHPHLVSLSGNAVLLYGDPALLVMAAEAPGLLDQLDRHERYVGSPGARPCPGERKLIAALRHDLQSLLKLSAIPPPQPAPTVSPPENDDGRADQARPSRSP